MDITQEITEQQNRGVLLVLTGPTASGKDVLFAKLLLKHPEMRKIVTTTTREPRPHEKNGEAYHFVSKEQFEEMIGNGDFFEWVEFREHLYGTQRKTIEEALQLGKDLVWRIEMKGVKNIKEKIEHMTNRSVFVFLTAPTVEELEKRVENDHTSERHRFNPALVKWEMSQFDACDYLVVNRDAKLDDAVVQVSAIIEAKRLAILPPLAITS